MGQLHSRTKTPRAHRATPTAHPPPPTICRPLGLERRAPVAVWRALAEKRALVERDVDQVQREVRSRRVRGDGVPGHGPRVCCMCCMCGIVSAYVHASVDRHTHLRVSIGVCVLSRPTQGSLRTTAARCWSPRRRPGDPSDTQTHTDTHTDTPTHTHTHQCHAQDLLPIPLCMFVASWR